MDQGTAVIRLAVFGNPIRQSLSPRIHNLFARQVGLEVEYRAIEAQASDFDERVHQLASEGALGCNITAPFKHQAYELATHHSTTAQRAGAANTLVFGETWYGDNTDGHGLVDDLGRRGFADVSGLNIAMLGAGGAAAGVLAALLMAGPERLVIANRTVARAEQLADAHSDLGAVKACAMDALSTLAPFDLLINATSQGHQGGVPGLDSGLLTEGGLLYDLNYGSAAAPLEAHCKQLGMPYADGLGMLVGQAAASFELWTGQSPDRAAVLAQLREEIRA